MLGGYIVGDCLVIDGDTLEVRFVFVADGILVIGSCVIRDCLVIVFVVDGILVIDDGVLGGYVLGDLFVVKIDGSGIDIG